jgi:hypothetical protein
MAAFAWLVLLKVCLLGVKNFRQPTTRVRKPTNAHTQGDASPQFEKKTYTHAHILETHVESLSVVGEMTCAH